MIDKSVKHKGVIFDLDGVITDTAEYHYLAWKKLADELNVYFDREINENLKGISRIESLEIILKKSNNFFSEEEKYYLADKKNEYYKEMINRMTPKDLLPGVVDLIRELKDRGIKIAVASVSKNAKTVLSNLGLIETFDYIVDAEKIKNGKPDPEIFLNAAAGIDVEPKLCIGIEDSKAGIEAINRAGMVSIGVGNYETVKGADIVLKDLSDPLPILNLL
ncbi:MULTISPECIES: beta-phosphoglucomutase [Thermoanaerobacterium]|uniref:Beta-phosphoglucomutase n=1 Tax=Thermoanaerobacterium xylanolyticum (strain ATCC 49914 / DSM 7097 / LX-11) TaxID=858215 RepID=F6BI18_THEXL|nr:beta-phosphoglucomutase [Thermoanaerobacterium xylanolyticum]AEF17692.1 beta-phosphoglucomutase [Thermoanaerobacterium xylanolyticum LX-11]